MEVFYTYTFVKTHPTVPWRSVYFTAGKFYLNLKTTEKYIRWPHPIPTGSESPEQNLQNCILKNCPGDPAAQPDTGTFGPRKLWLTLFARSEKVLGLLLGRKTVKTATAYWALIISNSPNNLAKQVLFSPFYRLKNWEQDLCPNHTVGKQQNHLAQAFFTTNSSFFPPFIHSNDQKQVSTECLPRTEPSVGPEVVPTTLDDSKEEWWASKMKSVRKHCPRLRRLEEEKGSRASFDFNYSGGLGKGRTFVVI